MKAYCLNKTRAFHRCWLKHVVLYTSDAYSKHVTLSDPRGCKQAFKLLGAKLSITPTGLVMVLHLCRPRHITQPVQEHDGQWPAPTSNIRNICDNSKLLTVFHSQSNVWSVLQ